jgi:PKD repeat protein
MKYIVTFLLLISSAIANAQSVTKRALFLGNSYTEANNLPQMIANIAASSGDVLVFDSNTPGGYTLQGHSSNATSLAKIAQGNWDYVILQEQSQLPAFPIAQVETSVFPYAQMLDNTINAQNPCAETVFYMTWGRKNGDAANCASWPPVCTYEGMDNLLNSRYRTMAENNNGIVSAVGAVWKHIRENFPLIDLYQSDESHPSIAGTYAAACSFYATLFRKDPTTITFNASLSPTEAANIRNATKLIIYDNLTEWFIGTYDPMANFTFTISNGNQVLFTNNSSNATTYHWDFGDNETSSDNNPTHTYLTPGLYTIQLTATKCGISNTTFQTLNITTPLGVNTTAQANNLIIYPNPATTILNVNHDFSNSITYQIVNSTGQVLEKGIINNFEKQIMVASLSDGMYFLQLSDNNQLLGQQKFVKSTN